MPSLNKEQINSYRSNGYLYPCDALSSEEVAAYRQGLAQTEDHLGAPLMDVDGKYRHNMHLLCKWMDELVRHPAILDTVESLLGPDLILYTSRFFIKGPNSEGFAAWHQDSSYFGLRPFDHVTAWVALSDVTIESGPMEFAKGSHIRGQLNQKSKMVEGSVNTAGQIIVEWFDQDQTELGVLKPGQFSLHHTCCVHQSAANRSDDLRIGVALSYIPTRTRNIGSVRMPVTLVRGQDSHGNFDFQARPETDFGAAETQCHDSSSELYLKNFYEQLELHEAQLPAA
ncbi:MAG: phytanoyl-CoA dioxygenase family protein [Rhodospirillales bacterium]|nr:phytanoyl-CoA dioxygenase family protein [Rhodospirillales bacterium]